MKIGAVLVGWAVLLASCAAYRPPFVQASSASGPADAHQATLVFLWPVTSCDPGGYYTLATTDGRFVGTVSAGKQLRAEVPPGSFTVVAWNDQEEQARGAMNKGAVSVLRATLSEGRTYYVRMAFGEWDNKGPRDVYAVRSAKRLCIAPDHVMTSAMVALTPASEAWKDLSAWTADLDALAPDRAAGQAWLDGNRGVVESHREIGEGRFEGLRPEARKMATLEAEDGVRGR
jgi:hypothetical protein